MTPLTAAYRLCYNPSMNIQQCAAVLEAVLQEKVVKATKYLSPKEIVRAVRRTYGGRIPRGNVEITLTIGKPNYDERAFVKTLVKAGEPFPMKKIQLKFERAKRKVKGTRK